MNQKIINPSWKYFVHEKKKKNSLNTVKVLDMIPDSLGQQAEKFKMIEGGHIEMLVEKIEHKSGAIINVWYCSDTMEFVGDLALEGVNEFDYDDASKVAASYAEDYAKLYPNLVK